MGWGWREDWIFWSQWHRAVKFRTSAVNAIAMHMLVKNYAHKMYYHRSSVRGYLYFYLITTINYQSHQELMRFVDASDPQWYLTA